MNASQAPAPGPLGPPPPAGPPPACPCECPDESDDAVFVKLEQVAALGVVTFLAWMTTLALVYLWVLKRLHRVALLLVCHPSVKSRLLSSTEEELPTAAPARKATGRPSKKMARNGEAQPDTPFEEEDT
tara:strand:+ start:12872 stop:13258 length:387 start_codon:yes stop_codon:yes gene_type:complete